MSRRDLWSRCITTERVGRVYRPASGALFAKRARIVTICNDSAVFFERLVFERKGGGEKGAELLLCIGGAGGHPE